MRISRCRIVAVSTRTGVTPRSGSIVCVASASFSTHSAWRTGACAPWRSRTSHDVLRRASAAWPMHTNACVLVSRATTHCRRRRTATGTPLVWTYIAATASRGRGTSPRDTRCCACHRRTRASRPRAATYGPQAASLTVGTPSIIDAVRRPWCVYHTSVWSQSATHTTHGLTAAHRTAHGA